MTTHPEPPPPDAEKMAYVETMLMEGRILTPEQEELLQAALARLAWHERRHAGAGEAGEWAVWSCWCGAKGSGECDYRRHKSNVHQSTAPGAARRASDVR